MIGYAWRKIELPKCMICRSSASVNMLEVFGKHHSESTGHICYQCVTDIVGSYNSHFGSQNKTEPLGAQYQSVGIAEKLTLPDAQTIMDDAFTYNTEMSYSQILARLKNKGEFSTGEAEHLIKQLMGEGYIYEFKSGFYKKA